MSQDFEKMDKEMMEALKELRGQKIPEGLLKDFSAGVEQKIRDRNVRPLGAGLGWTSFLALGVAFLVFGIVIWKLLPSRPRVIPIPARSAAESPAVFSTRATAPAAEKFSAPLAEAEISSEIEALRELGVWTDEDEQKLGIALEETFDELELAFEDNNQIPGQAIA